MKPGGDTRISWLGAFAMGLAVSSQTREERIRELIDASAADRDALTAAREHLGGLRLGDPSLRQSAARLLAEAAGALDRLDLVAVDDELSVLDDDVETVAGA